MSKHKKKINEGSESYQLRQKLNERGKHLNPALRDSAEQRSIREGIMALAFQIWSPYREMTPEQIERSVRTETKYEGGKKLSELEAEARMNAWTDVMESVFQKFDPARGVPLSAFIQQRWQDQTNTARKKLGVSGHRVADETDPNQKVWKPDVVIKSLNETIGSADERQNTMGDMIPTETDPYGEIEEQLKGEYVILTIMAHVLKLIEQRRGDKRSTYSYEQLFFTKHMVNYCKLDQKGISFQHEDEVWDVLKKPFIDFCLEDLCRSFYQIQHSEMKTYRQIGRGDKSNADARIAIPLKDIVGLAYLAQIENRSVSASTYGEQLERYRDSIRRLLEEKKLIADFYV